MLIIDASPQLWTPANLPVGSLSLWCDAADLSTITVVSGGVSQWSDKSGNNRHATTAVRRPALSLNVQNALSAITFTASSATKLDTPAFSIAPNREFCSFAVVSGAGLIAPSNTFPRIWTALGSGDSQSSIYSQGFFGCGSSNGTAMLIAGGSGVTQPQVTSLPTNQAVLLSGRFGTAGQSANTSSISAFGGTISSLASQTGALSTSGIRIGANTGASSVSAWNSWIGEVILTTGISLAQSVVVEGYLAWKWGLQGNLPTTHPFKNRAPLVSVI
jgi:hypothetical protein